MSERPERAEALADPPVAPPQVARARARAARERSEAPTRSSPTVPAPDRPVARVLVDLPLAHLDRPFDYLVPARLHETVTAGCRVKVRFAGRDVDGFVVDRAEDSDHPGRLSPLRRAVSAEPVLSPAVARLCELVATRYAGTRADVLRLAVPPRHAATEKRPSPAAPPWDGDVDAVADRWQRYQGGAGLVRGLARGAAPRAVWSALPGEAWPELLAAATAATLASGRGCLLCVPDHRDVARLDAALTSVLGEGRHVVLTAEPGPARRYRDFLSVARGAVRVVVGTRAAAFAPVHDLGLVAIWDDGDDLYAEPRAPYPHTREVLLLRAQEEHCAALVGGVARTVEAEYLLRTGWAAEVAASRPVVRAAAPSVAITGASDRELERDPLARSARLPRSAFEAVREGIRDGPVLLQTPRHGYATTLACDACRAPARCAACTGPLRLTGSGRPPSCRWCGADQQTWVCPECGGRDLRAPVLGDRRTAEEVGRAFPQVPVRTSSAERVLATVEPVPSLVVATPGAEPLVPGGYSCVVLLDTWLMLGRADLRTGEESLRRWLSAATLARGGPDGGRVVAVGDPAHPALQALLRWDPAGFARRELDDRRSAHLPPAARVATLTGPADDLADALATLTLPPGAEVLGPAPAPAPDRLPRSDADGPPPLRALVRVPRSGGAALSRTLRELQRVRSARKLPPVRVQVDPVALG